MAISQKPKKSKARDMPIGELTLRKYERPYRMSQREKVKKVCLSLGLLQPGDSRDIIVDILHLLIRHKKGLSYGKLEDMLLKKRKRHRLPMVGVTASNIHRQLRRLKELFIIEKHLDLYRLSERMTLSEIFEQKIIGHYLDSIIARVREYCDELEPKKKR